MILESDDFEREETDEKIEARVKAHKEYIESLAGKYNPTLYKLFLETSEFHDFYIWDVHYNASTNKWHKEKTDKIIVELEEALEAHNYYKIEFSNITRFLFDSHGKMMSEVCAVLIGDFSEYDRIRSQIGEIVKTEIGIDEYEKNYIRFVTSSAYVIHIGFKKFKILEKKEFAW